LLEEEIFLPDDGHTAGGHSSLYVSSHAYVCLLNKSDLVWYTDPPPDPTKN
jgi:hypothetical protein